ncbi:MAG: MATE family efflux transporter, partial [Pseudomonadota bacterium]
MKKDLSATIRELILFASPIALGQLSHMLIGVGDIFIAAHYSRNTLAAMGIANAISVPIFLIGLGLLLGISPTIAKKRGEAAEVSQYFYTCIAYAFVIGIVFMSVTICSVLLIPHLGFDESIVPLIQDYLFYASFSYIGAYVFMAIKEYLQASEDVLFANAVSVATVFVNLLLGYMLAFGVFIFPELGIRGLAYGAVIVRSLMAITIFLYARRHNKTTFSVIRHFITHVFKFSIPISMSIFIEVLAFSVVMILIGRIAPLYAAAHSICLNLASATYMVPLAISSGVSVKIAYHYGRKNFERIKDFMKAGM